ncbi:hypothetical protein KT71_13679 [Congregibacter litoralis KT71]|uniref:Uncharacterized protein n=1 Tax=Congregibacter litoralis KT71 TaxID=314285 RepID=A4ADZ3_9GAMM|nr:hypothetical protein KT71_13679 [Congregibacter litoralis KT71]
MIASIPDNAHSIVPILSRANLVLLALAMLVLSGCANTLFSRQIEPLAAAPADTLIERPIGRNDEAALMTAEAAHHYRYGSTLRLQIIRV